MTSREFEVMRNASKQEIKTPRIWVYDYRAKIHHTLKTNPLKASDLDDFIKCYNPQNIEKRTATYSDENPDGRWRCYEWSEIKDRSDLNFDFKWLKDDNDQYADLSLSELVENYESQLLALNESFKVLKDELLALPNDVISQDDSCNDFSLKSISELQTAIWRRCLSEAISGRLTTQQPSDGTADDLLEQIKAAHREAFATTQKKYKPLTFSQIPDSEIPFDIPENWKWVRLGEIGDWGSGSTPDRTNPTFYNGNVIWIKTGELNNSIVYDSEEKISDEALRKGSFKINKVGDVMIAMYGATIGKLGIAGKEMVTNQACCGCTLYGGINNKYLFYYLMANKDRFIKMGAGGAQPNISRTKIIAYPFPLPPLSEQLRIVTKLEKLRSALDKRG